MLKNKRLWIGLGSTIAAVTPVIAVVSCGSSSTTVREHQMSKADIEAYNAELKAWQDDFYLYDWSEDAIQGKWVVENSFAGIDLTNVKGKNSGKDFYLPTFIESIDSNAFSEAILPKTFELPKNLQTIGTSAFKATDLSHLDKKDFIPDRTWYLKDNAFTGAILPEGFKIKDSVISLGSSVFSSADLPKDFTFVPDITTIPDNLFNSAKVKSKIVVPETVLSIGNNAFSDVVFSNYGTDHGLTLPKKLTTIGTAAFAGSTFEFRLEIPSSITTLGESVFNNTKFKAGLDMLSGNEGTKIPENTFASSEFTDATDGKLTINFADKIKYFGEKAFIQAKLPKDFELPSKIESLAKSVFSGSSVVIYKTDLLTKVQNTLNTISAFAFQDANLPEGFTLPSERQDPETGLQIWTSANLGYAFNNAALPDGFDWDKTASDGPKPGAKLVIGTH